MIASLEQLRATGARLVGGSGWNHVERWQDGELAVPSSTSKALASCSSDSAKAVVVASCSPPVRRVMSLRVAAPSAEGDLDIQVYGGGGAVKTPYDFASGPRGREALNGRAVEIGALIAGTGRARLRLAAPLEVGLEEGDVLVVFRTRYAPLTGSACSPSLDALARYVLFLADALGDGGGYVYVDVEGAWADLASLYESPPASLIPGGRAQLEAMLDSLETPDGVEIARPFRLPATAPATPRLDVVGAIP